jgi:hypothetical protein
VRIAQWCYQKSPQFLEFFFVSIGGRVRPFRLKNFSLISEIKRNWIRFTCISLFHYKFHFSFFASFRFFRFKFFASFTLVIFASKWNKASPPPAPPGSNPGPEAVPLPVSPPQLPVSPPPLPDSFPAEQQRRQVVMCRVGCCALHCSLQLQYIYRVHTVR